MLMRRPALRLLSAAALAVIMHAAPAHARKVCKPMVWGYGLHTNQNIAKLHALGAWTTKAKNQYGAAYGSYGAAKSKSQLCRREGPPRPNAMYNCVV
jgi:hypothetical protein